MDCHQTMLPNKPSGVPMVNDRRAAGWRVEP
jgi:hypothetical protein